MYWFHFNFCVIVLALLTPYTVSGEESRITNFNADEEALPLEQTVDVNDGSKMAPNQADRRVLRQSFRPNTHSNMEGNTGFQFPQGLAPTLSYMGQSPDAQESSASNKVVLVLDNDKKSKSSDHVQPAEEPLKRLTRNPDALDDIIGQFQQFGGDMTQQLLQQFAQTAPDISKSFGQALNEALTQTNLLAQVPPLNFNFTQMREDSMQSSPPGSMDFGQLGQSLSQNFLLGATQNLFNPIRNRAASEGAPDTVAAVEPGRLGAAAPGAEVETSQGPDAAKNPFLGHSLLPSFRPIPQFKPFGGMFARFPALGPLIPSGSDISEVRVLPEQYSPYKVSPKQVDLQTMAEMRLRAVLKEAINKKTIPILWFHLPTNRKLQNDKQDVEMEAKLQIFEDQVIAELKQLQELASMANEVKSFQLQSGAQPTTSLKTKLNLFEIPIYDITLGDIEKTLKDEHVMMLLQTLVQKQNKEFQRHQQATTKYLTDLTGAPAKRQTKSSEDILNAMEKDDMMKMMSYAARMASLNGHEMPWLKNTNITSSDVQETAKGSKTAQQEQQQQLQQEQKQQSQAFSTQMSDEKKWLEDKQQKITIEEAKQRHMFSNVQRKVDTMRQWADPAMVQQQIPQQRQMVPPQMQQQMPVQKPMMPPQVQQPVPQVQQAVSLFPLDLQMVPPQIQQQMPVQTPMMPSQMLRPMPLLPLDILMALPQMPVQTPMIPPQVQQQMAVERQMTQPQNQMFDIDMPMQHPDTARQMWPLEMQQRNQMFDIEMPVQHQGTPNHMMTSPMQQRNQMRETEMQTEPQNTPRQMMPPQMQQQMLNFDMQRQDNPLLQQQKMKTNVDMEQAMLIQKQQQHQPKTEMQQFQRNSADKKMPEMKSDTKQESEPKQSSEMKVPEKPTGFNTEKITKTQPTATGEIIPRSTDQKQKTETESPANQAAKDMKDMDNKPTVTEVPEEEGKARFKGSNHLLDPLGLFHHRHHHIGKDLFKPPVVYNYYHGRYPPVYAPPPPPAPVHHIYGPAAGYPHLHHNYHHPPPAHYHYQPATSQYHHGSNAYGGYRSATGDEEIAIMLQQQQQQQQQSKPKMMMPNNDEFTTPTTTTKTTIHDKSNAEHPIKDQPKRLAKKHTKRSKSPAAYVIVVRNNHSNSSSSSKSGRSRRKRSANFATLEPIDENSLTALRKAYKNSLKEITLNPNETPAEALMRYNAESIREALEKANKQPMEITAGQEGEEIKDNKSEKMMEHRNMLQQQISKPLTQAYALRDHGQFGPVTAGPENPASNGPYIILPNAMQHTQALPVSFNQQHLMMYDPGQETVYNNMISKSNTPIVYGAGNKFLTQNPFVTINNPVETLPYIDEYGVVNQPYQLADDVEKANKFIVYQKPDTQSYSTHNDFLTSSNAINKNLQHFSTAGHHLRDSDKTKMWQHDNFVRELPTTKTDYSVPHMANKNDYIDAYSHMRRPPTELTTSYRAERSHHTSSLESIIALIKEQLVECCDTCKDDILKRLDATLKHQQLEKSSKPYNTFIDKPYTWKYHTPSNHRDMEHKQWLGEMTEKGYDKAQLTKQHQADYLRDGKLNLHVAANVQRLGQEVERIFFKNNQSSKRKTNIFETADIVPAPLASVSRAVKPQEEEEEEEEERELEEEGNTEVELEDHQTESKTASQSNNEDRNKKSSIVIKKTEMPPTKEKLNAIDKKARNVKENSQTSNTNKTIHAAESTTHSVYALRGQFRAHKAQPMPFTPRQGKQFDNFKNINKLSTSNILTKSRQKENADGQSDQLEEILDRLLDLSASNRNVNKSAVMGNHHEATISSSYSGTPYTPFSEAKPLPENTDSTTANAVNIVEQPRKLMRRRTKSQKLV